MAKVKIQGNANGTGTLTLTAPNTNSDRTITLPDGDVTLAGGVAGIVSNADATAMTIGSDENVTFVGTITTTSVDLGNWTLTESGGVLYFATSGTNKMKLDASGNLTCVGNVTAYGTM
jgi:hypothetical protein